MGHKDLQRVADGLLAAKDNYKYSLKQDNLLKTF